MSVLGKMCEELPPDPAGEEALKDDLLSRTPCIFLKHQTENDTVVTMDRVSAVGRRITELQDKLAGNQEANSMAITSGKCNVN